MQIGTGTDAGAGRAGLGYFQKPLPVALILGSFFFLTLPLCVLAAGDEDFLQHWSLGLIYLCVLGMTHFVLTLTIYAQGANLRHFASTRANRLAYFAVPVLIFLSFDLYRALRVAVALPLLDLGLRYGIRLLDFQHFGRQNYGVLQLFKARARVAFPGWMRRAEDACFAGMTVLLFVVYLTGGRFRRESPTTLVLLAVVLGLIAWVLVGFALAWSRSGRHPAVLPPLAYFLLQSCSSGLAVYSTSLYAFGLAMHYVEYHVLMVPRCFHAPMDGEGRADRLFGRLRRHKVLFYGLLILLAAWITRFTWLSMGPLLKAGDESMATPYLLLISAFDGLFVFHYFIESMIWRFGDPFYRRSLMPLYFAQDRRDPGRIDEEARVSSRGGPEGARLHAEGSASR